MLYKCVLAIDVLCVWPKYVGLLDLNTVTKTKESLFRYSDKVKYTWIGIHVRL